MRLVLILLLAAVTLFRLWLGRRQLAHVRAGRGAVPADFAASIDLPAHQRAADYVAANLRLSMVEQIVDLAVTALWLWGGINLLYGALAGVLAPGLWRSVAVVLGFSAIGSVIGMPFRLWHVFVIEARFGFNRTTWPRFAADTLKGMAIGLVIAVPLLAAGFRLMHAGFGLWWLFAWAGFMVVTLAIGEAYPRLIAPLFNRFTPLEGELRARLEALVARCGFRAEGLFVMDASRRSAKGNAYFTGFGRAKRIVLFDTLLARHSDQEIEAVLAHELGHFRHGHVLMGIIRLALVSFAAFLFFGELARLPWLTESLGLAPDDALALLAFMLWFSALGPLLGLAGNWFSRRAEFQADAFASRQVGAEPLVSALIGLTRDNAGTLTPDPLYAMFMYSHPPVPVRVRHLRGL